MPLLFFRDRKLLLKKLAELKIVGGFDSLHLPGGTSLDGKGSSFIVAWFYNKLLREKFLLVVPYKSDFFKTEVVILVKKKESWIKTAVRETLEETGIKFPPKYLHLFYKALVPSNLVKGEVHIKTFYHYTKYLDILQIVENFYEGGGEIGSPFFIKSTLVKDYLFIGHYAALRDDFRK